MAKSAKKKSRRKAGKAPAAKKTSEKSAIPRRIFANVSPASIGGVSMFDAGSQITEETVANFCSEDSVMSQAVSMLQQAGFDVLQVTESTINISGTKKRYEDAFGTKITVEERPVIKELGKETTAGFLECPSSDLPGLIPTKGTSFEGVIEGVALEEPRYFMAPSSYAPLEDYWHLSVPADVSLGCNADRAHRGGTTGKGVTVAMVDSGHYKHPFFTNRGYRVSPVVLV